MLSKPEPWLQKWIAELMKRHPEIEQVYLLGNQARGPRGQKPNYSLLLYAGYDHALNLMMALAREEDEVRPADEIIHLYVENYGATFCGLWGGALIPNALNCDWLEGFDFSLWIDVGRNSRPLLERLRLPEERRQGERRDQLAPFFDEEQEAREARLREEERRNRNDRRRDNHELTPLLRQH